MVEEKVGHDELSALQDKLEAESAPVAEEKVADEQTTQPKTDVKEEATEQPTEETLETIDELPEEPEDNAERSKLGRRVSSLQEEISSLKSLLLEQQRQPQSIPEYDDVKLKEEEFDMDPDEPLTLRDLEKREAYKAQQEERANQLYNNSYSNFIQQMSGNDLHDEICEELKANFNVRRTTDGFADAEVNYLNAKTAVLERKMSELSKPQKSSPLSKNKGGEETPLGGPTDTQNPPPASSMPKMDSYAEDFIKYHEKRGKPISEERVKKALDGPTPTYLGGR
jgi:hypothetical protein